MLTHLHSLYTERLHSRGFPAGTRESELIKKRNIVCRILAPPCTHVSSQLIIIFPFTSPFCTDLSLYPPSAAPAWVGQFSSWSHLCLSPSSSTAEKPMLQEHSHSFHVTATALSCFMVWHREVAKGRSYLGATVTAPVHSQYCLGKIQLCTLMLAEKVSKLCILIWSHATHHSHFHPSIGLQQATWLDLPPSRDCATPHPSHFQDRETEAQRCCIGLIGANTYDTTLHLLFSSTTEHSSCVIHQAETPCPWTGVNDWQGLTWNHALSHTSIPCFFPYLHPSLCKRIPQQNTQQHCLPKDEGPFKGHWASLWLQALHRQTKPLRWLSVASQKEGREHK